MSEQEQHDRRMAEATAAQLAAWEAQLSTTRDVCTLDEAVRICELATGAFDKGFGSAHSQEYRDGAKAMAEGLRDEIGAFRARLVELRSAGFVG